MGEEYEKNVAKLGTADFADQGIAWDRCFPTQGTFLLYECGAEPDIFCDDSGQCIHG